MQKVYYAAGDEDFDATSNSVPTIHPYLFGHSLKLSDETDGGYWQFATTMSWNNSYASQFVIGTNGHPFFRTYTSDEGWTNYRKFITSVYSKAKYDFNNLKYTDGLSYDQMTLPLYNYSDENFCGFGVTGGGVPVLRVGTSNAKRHNVYFCRNGSSDIYIDDYKFLSTAHVSVSGTTLNITL